MRVFVIFGLGAPDGDEVLEDVVECRIPGVGVLMNPVVAQQQLMTPSAPPGGLAR